MCTNNSKPGSEFSDTLATRSFATHEQTLKTHSYTLSQTVNQCSEFRAPSPQQQALTFKLCSMRQCLLTLASVTLNSLRIYWGMLYSAIGSTTKYWYLADLSAGQYWWHFSCRQCKIEYHSEPQHSLHCVRSQKLLSLSIYC